MQRPERALANPEAADTGRQMPHALRLEEFLPYRLSVVSNRISRALAGLYEDRFGITPAEWRLIAILARFGPLSAGGVAERSAMDKVQVSRAVAKAVEAGLVDRRTDRTDRRRSVLTLTARGQEVHDRIVPLARDLDARIESALSAPEHGRLMDLLGRLDAAVAVLSPPEGPNRG
ncbi:MAG TPA: MarR family winged helix-turn-helix transcriptional regulator [Azospirillaceae bacterium]|nr:MarR family winged helix-turn-helix transcriptional regulator [Azospirillaceae bacterium]